MLLLLLYSALFGTAAAHTSSGRTRHGFIHYSFKMYDPPCAYGCRDTLGGYFLECEEYGSGGHSHHGSMDMPPPTPQCYATNDFFLQSMAWCISTHCKDVPVAKLEEYWAIDLVGRKANQAAPKWSYQESLFKVTEPPTEIADPEEILNTTTLVDEESYQSNYNGDSVYDIVEYASHRYGLVLVLTCTAIPIGFSLLRFLPLPKSLVTKFYAYLIDPPVFGRNHAVPVLGLAIIPTRGQALFIAYIWIINIVLSTAGYHTRDPNSWYTDAQEEIASFISNRVGVLSFANLILTVLYSSRNNILLYVTNWSHSTFLLVHRWIAVICTIQACLHSAIWLKLYIDMGAELYEPEVKEKYWIWGIIATLCLSLMIPLSIVPIRQRIYEVFLASHVILAIFALTGSLLHIWYRFTWQWGYETWIYTAFAVWGFDRLFARPLRIARNGIKRALVTVVDDDYLRVDIPGLEASGQVYLYFPTLSWRVWENHPFSVAAVPGQGSALSRARSSSPSSEDVEKTGAVATILPSTTVIREPGTTFYVRRRGGLTAKFTQLAQSSKGTIVLVESSYGPEQMSIIPSPTARPSLQYPNTIFIAGGVGITAVIPLLNHTSTISPALGVSKLFWGVRTEPLVRSVEQLLGQEHIGSGGTSRWKNIEVTLSVGKRFDLQALLEAELSNVQGGTTVVVCGPPGMADDARVAVTALGRKGVVVRLTEESFSW